MKPTITQPTAEEIAKLASSPENWPKVQRGPKEKLAPYIDTIRRARCSGRGYKQITEFLKQHGVETTYQNVVNFCKRNFK